MAKTKKLTKKKAGKILKDNSAHGKPLTEKQKGFFGAIAGGAKPKTKAMAKATGRKMSKKRKY